MNLLKAAKVAKQVNKRIAKWQGIEPGELRNLGIQKSKDLILHTHNNTLTDEIETELSVDIGSLLIAYNQANGYGIDLQKAQEVATEWNNEAQKNNEEKTPEDGDTETTEG